MTAYALLSKKVTTITDPIPPTVWKTVVTFDWRDPAKVYAQVDTSNSAATVLSRAKSLKATNTVAVLGYLNVQANLAAGVFDGGWATRFVRIGTTNDTGLQSQNVVVPPAKAGTQAPTHFATPYWFGANPGGFLLQVRHLTGFFDTFQIDTRDIKVMWWT